MRGVFFLLILMATLQSGCKKENESKGIFAINVSHRVDEKSLVFDTKEFVNEPGYPYSVTRMEYYLSAFSFKDDKGNFYTSDKVFYVNAKHSETCALSFSDIPAGDYTEVHFLIGLDSLHNQTYYLEATVDNTNMAWPDMMGGGYHFMKLEGYFTASSSNTGYAMHLGKNGNAVAIHLTKSFTVAESGNSSLALNMNINEWYKNPEVYDFVTDGVYSMGNDVAMQKLSRNGVDVFN